MKHKIAKGDSLHINDGLYLVAREKGYSVPYTMLIHLSNIEEVKKITKLTAKAQALFYVMAQNMDFDHTVHITLDKIMVYLDCERSRSYAALQALKGADLVRKYSADRYKMNPKYVWRGSSKERVKALEEWNLSNHGL